MTLETIDGSMVETALKHLQDVQKLGTCDLARFEIVEAKCRELGFRVTVLGRGTALKAILRDVIEDMKPPEQSHRPIPNSAQARYYTILSEQYFEGSDRTFIMEILAIASDGYYSKLRRQAIDHVANKLGEMEQQHLQAIQQRATSVQVNLEKTALLAPPQPPDTFRPEYFVGRASEIEHYRRQLERDGFTVISGFPGIGKSALAAELTRQVARKDRVLWHRCRPNDDSESLIWAVAQFLAWHGQDRLWHNLTHAAEKHSDPLPLSVRIDYVRQYLLNRGYLVCLDDLHVLRDDTGAMRLVEDLIEVARGKQVQVILITRRLPAFLAGGRIWPLGGLQTEDVRRFVEQKGLDLTEWELGLLQRHTEGNPELIGMAIELLQRMPNAVARLEDVSESTAIQEFIAREVDRGLSENERATMMAMAVLQGEAGSREAVENIAAGNSGRELVDLAQRYLVDEEGIAGRRVYRLRGILQTFYLALPSLDERSVLHLRAAEFYAQNESERDWFRAAAHYLEAKAPVRAAQILRDHVDESVNRGQAGAALRLLDRLVKASLDPLLITDLIITRAEVHVRRGDSEAARSDYDHALWRLADGNADDDIRGRRARVYRGLGYLLLHSDPAQALAHIQRGLAEIEGSESPERAALLIRQGHIQVQMGEFDAALHSLQQGVALLPPTPSQLRGIAFLNLGNVYGFRGDRRQAEECYQRAVAIIKDIDDDWRMMDFHLNLGIEADLSGRWSEADVYYKKALAMAQDWGGVKVQAAAELALGNLRLKQGRAKQAEQHYGRSLGLARQHALKDHCVDALLGMATLHLQAAAPGPAQICLIEATQIATVIGSRGHWPELERLWAGYYLATAQSEQAYEHAVRAVATAQELDIAPEVGMGLRVLAQILQIQRQHQAALDYLAESHALLQAWNPYEAALTEAAWARSLQALGQEEEARSRLASARRVFRRLKIPATTANAI